MVQLPYFNNAEVELFDGFDENDLQAAEALATFLALTPADRLKDSRHVFAYYCDFREAVGGEDWLDAEMGIPEKPEDIWDHVTPNVVGVWKGRGDDKHTYIFVEANCVWEEEHGLLLVWRDGKVLNKAGGFDGHPTNAGAYADNAMSDVVYRASNPDYTTRLDPQS